MLETDRSVAAPSTPSLLRLLAVLTAGFLVVGLVFRTSSLGERFDGRTVSGLGALREDSWFPWTAFAHLGDPAVYLLCCLALIALAAYRRQRRWVVAVPVTMLLSELTAQALKQVLARERPFLSEMARVSDAAWPSGHSTAIMTAALLAIVLVPVRVRPQVALGAAVLVILTGIGILADGYHYPTDVIGGFLWASCWVIGAVLVVRGGR